MTVFIPQSLKSMLMPGCSETVKCYKLPNGKGEAVTESFTMPQHSVCKNGPPASIGCAKNYKLSADGKKCLRKLNYFL